MSEESKIEDKPEQFPITGKFNVPDVFPVIIKNQKIDPIKNLDLPKYKEGTLMNPHEGYYIHRMEKATEFITEKNDLKKIFNDLIIIDFIADNIRTVSKYKDGKMILERKKIGVSINNIFWIVPDFLIIRGSKETSKNFKRSFERIFKKDIILGDSYKFDPWFFLWIIFKHRSKKELDNDFYVDLILDMGVEGEVVDLIGKVVTAKQSLDVTKSISVLLPLLARKLPSEFLFGITVDNLACVIKLKKNGSILVSQTRGKLKDLNALDRTILTCFFIKKVIQLYEKWDSLPKLEKIPSPEFIKDIVQECRERGYQITADVTATIDMYKEKRK